MRALSYTDPRPVSRRSEAAGQISAEAGGAAKGLASILAALVLFAHMGSALGPIVPIVSLAASLAIFLLQRHRVHPRVLRFGWLFALPALALASSAWSRVPVVTFYYGAQLLVTFLAAPAIWLAGDARAFIRQLFAASLAICLVSMVTGQTGPSATGPVLVGITGSKNAMAAAGQCVVFCALALVLDRAQPPAWRVAGGLALPLGGWIVAVTRAATIEILTLAALPIGIAFVALGRCPVKIRPFLAAGILISTLAGAVVAGQVAQRAEELTLRTFDKDKGLTGRTYLWAVAGEKIADRPWQGYGYKAFWMSGSADSIGLLRSQRIADPRTFSLHETFLEVWLDLGIPGLLAAVAMLAAGLVAALYRAVRFGAVPDVFVAIFLVCLVVRAFGETLFQPFYAYGTIATVLVALALFGHGLLQEGVSQQAPGQARSSRLP